MANFKLRLKIIAVTSYLIFSGMLDSSTGDTLVFESLYLLP